MGEQAEVLEDHAEPASPEVAHALGALVQALQPVLRQNVARQTAVPQTVDPAAQRKVMDQLLQMLRDDDANAQRHFSDHAALFGALLGENYLRVKSAMDSLALDEALEIGGHKTKKATVNEALREYIQRRKQAEIIQSFGKIDFDPSYDYKRQRKRP